MPDRGAEDAGLRERRVDDPVLAEVLLQAVGDPEDAAELADVLAHDQDLRVVLHRLAQPGVEALGQGHLAHRARLRLERVEVGGVARLLLDELLGLLGVDVVEDVQRLRLRQRPAALAQVLAELLGLPVDLLEELRLHEPVAGEVGLHPLDRVLELPGLEVLREPVARRVVGGGVRAHAVGVRLHQRRALAVAGPLQGGLRDGVRREHVVAVDPHAGEAEAQRPLVERDPGLPLDRLGDGPLVVLAEEHHRRVVGGGEDERLVDVALAAGAVTEVGHHRGVAVGVAGADHAVALHAHGVAGRVQRLRADDDRVEPEVAVVGVPAALVDAPEQAEQPQRVDVAAPGDAVLAVGREDEVLRAQRAAGADLRGLLAEQLGPDAELAVPLQRGRLGVDAAGQHHVAVEARDRLVVEVEGEVRVLDPLALGRQQLDEVGSAVGVVRPEDLTQVGAEVGPGDCACSLTGTPLSRRRAGSPLPTASRGVTRRPRLTHGVVHAVVGRSCRRCDRHHTGRRRPKVPKPVDGRTIASPVTVTP